jgi:hypothetical protein
LAIVSCFLSSSISCANCCSAEALNIFPDIGVF